MKPIPHFSPNAIEPLRKQVYEYIRNLIVAGYTLPGDRLLEADLASLMNVSRGPVRDAILRLERESWVVTKPRQGAYVWRPTPDDMKDFRSARGALSREAARLAAIHHTDEHANDLIQALADDLEAKRVGDGYRRIETNTVLHAAIMTASGNKIIEKYLTLLDLQYRWYYGPLNHKNELMAKQHEEIVNSILAREAERAATLMHEHIDASYEAYMEGLKIHPRMYDY